MKYNIIRTSTLHFDDLAGELEAEEYRINTTSSSAANYVKNRQGSNSTQGGKQQNKGERNIKTYEGPICKHCENKGRSWKHHYTKCWTLHPELMSESQRRRRVNREKGNNHSTKNNDDKGKGEQE